MDQVFVLMRELQYLNQKRKRGLLSSEEEKRFFELQQCLGHLQRAADNRSDYQSSPSLHSAMVQAKEDERTCQELTPSPSLQKKMKEEPFETLSPSSEKKTPRWRLFLLCGIFVSLLVLSFLLWWPSSPSIKGESRSIQNYQRYLPVMRAYRHKSTLSLLLAPRWQKQVPLQQLEERLFRLGQKLRSKGISQIRVYTPSKKKLYQLNL